jgi:hypothetical protein
MKLSGDFDRRLVDLLNEVCEAYEAEHPDRVMWPSGYGSAPKWSKRDAAFLGLSADDDAPDSGEPTFDDSTFQISISEREAYPEDIASRSKRKARAARPAPEYREPTLEDASRIADIARRLMRNDATYSDMFAALRAGGFVVREEGK